MKITLITLDNWGFNAYVVKELKNQGHNVNHIDYDKFRYEYPSYWKRVTNFLSKTILRKNIKKEILHQEIIKRIDTLEKQDVILMIKADYLLPKTIQEIKPKCSRFISFFNDNYKRAKNIKNVYPYFDRVFSFEKEDVQTFGFQFITNFIYRELPLKNERLNNALFNVSSYDLERLKVIENIAYQLDLIDEDYAIFSIGKKAKAYQHNTNINYTTTKLNLVEIEKYVEDTMALLDVHRDNQNGLTFRVFESLGYKKKLITTNRDIVNYDFYDSNNILVVDKNNVEIPKLFFETPYKPVPEEIYNKYTLRHWCKTVLNA
ncbi:hypothetical protein [Winogradskyella sp.]|uniref:hypothetical protein n=1 Tax=Winogradskyella sp. TaxID=1883156 RepID=UPI002635907F|nr:hypothetical protein [Winogradskyella sp.]